MKYPHKIIPLFFLALLSSSINAQINPDHQFTHFEVDGIPTARTTGGPKYSGELFTYNQLLEILENPENEETLLFRPQDIICDDSGQYYISDYGNHRVAVYDSVGQYLYSFGEWGQGPGNFEMVDIIGFHEGVLTLFDSQLLRSTRYRTNGDLVEVLTSSNLRGSPNAIYRANEDRIVALAQRNPSTDTHSLWQSRVEILNSSGTLISELETQELPVTTFTSLIINEGGGGTRAKTGIPYSSRPRAAYHPIHGIILTSGMEPVIEKYDLDGKLIMRIELALPVERVSRQERIQSRQLYISWIAAFEGFRKEMSKRQLEALEFPPHKAFWSDIYIDNRGYFWLREPSDLGYWFQTHPGTSFKVLSPEGEYLGRTTWPASSRVDLFLHAHVANGKLMVWVEDEINGGLIPTVFQLTEVPPRFTYHD